MKIPLSELQERDPNTIKRRYFIKIQTKSYDKMFGFYKEITQGIFELSDNDINKIDGEILTIQPL